MYALDGSYYPESADSDIKAVKFNADGTYQATRICSSAPKGGAAFETVCDEVGNYALNDAQDQLSLTNNATGSAQTLAFRPVKSQEADTATHSLDVAGSGVHTDQALLVGQQSSCGNNAECLIVAEAEIGDYSYQQAAAPIFCDGMCRDDQSSCFKADGDPSRGHCFHDAYCCTR